MVCLLQVMSQNDVRSRQDLESLVSALSSNNRCIEAVSTCTETKPWFTNTLNLREYRLSILPLLPKRL